MPANSEQSALFKAILLLKTEEEAAAFFDDLCTIREIQDMSQRFEVAELLYAGKNYGEISAETGASSATISRVNRCLHYGKNGYKSIIEKMESEKNE